ncbi:MAG TPA: aminotransferase class V-fold PLP-dependent enzyme [Gemmatimonadaceae bacterium]|nr:aminotransferase class V-fold PLP-dependent enzyme [Gemmatimonadaceae bacterium]
MPSRREFLGSLALGAAGTAAPPALRDDWWRVVEDATRFVDRRAPQQVAQDEDFWREIQRAFTVDRSISNLNNGGVSPSPRVVQEAMARYLAISNDAPAYTMWQLLEPQIESVRRQLARSFGCDPEEMAITRNASEALEIVQLGMRLERGDEVLTTNQDYPRMLTTWEQRARREGIVLRQISFPVPPPSMKDLVDRFERAIGPRTKVIHCCHITNRSGQIFPVRDIVRMAGPRGIEVVVDGAHAYAQFPFRRDDLECDYYGTSLHKWLLAPHGTGFLYVRKEKIKDIWPLMAAPESMDADIRKFEEIGTHPAANHNAIAEALAFHEGIGAERKAARLRYLRDRWMRRLEGKPRVKLNTSFDPAMSCGLAHFGIEGIESGALVSHLWRTRRIFVVGVDHAEYKGIRVTPNVYTRIEEIDAFAEAMEEVLRSGVRS